MTEVPSADKKNDWEGYEKARAKNRENHHDYLVAYSNRAYEYGLLAVKNMMLIAGGALVALPAISGISDSISAEIAAQSGLFFAVSLLTSIACSYFAHLNWQANYDSQEFAFRRDQAEIRAIYLTETENEGSDSDEYKAKLSKEVRIILATFYNSHILGICSFLNFGYACYVLFSNIK